MRKFVIAMVLIAAGPWIVLEWAMNPKCVMISVDDAKHSDDRSGGEELKVMVVADLHMAGEHTAMIDRIRRESFLMTTFQRAKEKLEPDMLVVLGDISDEGRWSTDSQWRSVAQRFRDITSSFVHVPIHVIPGNHDIGDHDVSSAQLVQRFSASFPGLDQTGSSFFQWSGISFLSLNAMAMVGDGCSLCSGVEKVIEKTSHQLANNRKLDEVSERSEDALDAHTERESCIQHGTRAKISGPVVFLHLPLYRVNDTECLIHDIPRCGPWHEVHGGCTDLFGQANLPLLQQKPYRLGLDILSENVSHYLLQALNPRIILNGHTHRFCERIHDNGVREITVPTLSWRNRDDPSFVLLIFHKTSIEIRQCFIARESFVLALYSALAMGFITCTLAVWLWPSYLTS